MGLCPPYGKNSAETGGERVTAPPFPACPFREARFIYNALGLFLNQCMDPQLLDNLGIIAGNRSLPLLLARQARRMGVQRLVAIAFVNETDPAFASLGDKIFWVRGGQLSKLVSGLGGTGDRHCGMAGRGMSPDRFL